jgi:hypothetical protein
VRTVFILEYTKDGAVTWWFSSVHETRELAQGAVDLVIPILEPGFADGYRISEALIEDGKRVPVAFTGPPRNA